MAAVESGRSFYVFGDFLLKQRSLHGSWHGCDVQIGNNLVKPQITEKCLSCHPDFSLLSGIKAKAAAIEKRVGDKTMPPPNSPPLGGLERGVILRWIRMGFLPQP